MKSKKYLTDEDIKHLNFGFSLLARDSYAELFSNSVRCSVKNSMTSSGYVSVWVSVSTSVWRSVWRSVERSALNSVWRSDNCTVTRSVESLIRSGLKGPR